MALNRIPTNELDTDQDSFLPVIASDPSSASSTKVPTRLGARSNSTHSLLAAGGAAELRRSIHTVSNTDKTSMDRASISMPPPKSNAAADRRLSSSLSSGLSYNRRSEDLARSPPSSVKSFDDRQLTTSPPFSTTATDTTSITTSSALPTPQGVPLLSPPLVYPGASQIGNSSLPPLSTDQIREPVKLKDTVAAALFAPPTSDVASEGAFPVRPRKPRSTSSSRRISGTGPRAADDTQADVLFMGKIGVCALDVKARSRPSRQILTRLQGDGEFEVIVFGDKVILDEAVENWPICDFLISFFSDGFPLDKAIAYAKMRKPFLVNDLMMQKVLWDRRLCLRILDQLKVPTPERIEVNRDGGPRLESTELAQHLKKMSGVTLAGAEDGTGGGAPMTKETYMADDDTLVIDGRHFKKPFVEKPVSGEDHNVIIYFSKNGEGGARRLFRKIGNKSSEFDPQLVTPRCITETDSSYIYEQFLKTDNAEDVKAYTVGPNFCHAETRKSPVVDGLVRRNTHGKELRYVTKLSEDEKTMAAKVAMGFGQRICGFDMLRSNNGSHVIDVNGWSFVKDNEAYYNECANILRELFYQNKFANNTIDEISPNDTPPETSHRRQTGTFFHRQALRTILKSPSMSKLSAHIPHPGRSHHGSISGAASPKLKDTPTLSSPPSMERPPGTGIQNRSEVLEALPPPAGLFSPQNLTDEPLSTLANSENEIPAPLPSSKHSWKLKGVVTVIRHADRTPKQKIKFTAHSQVFVDLLKGHHEEVLLKGAAALASVETAVRIASQQKLEDPEKMRNLRNALARKGGQPGTKVQIKPMFRKRKPEELRPSTSHVPSEAPVPEHEVLNHSQSGGIEKAVSSPDEHSGSVSGDIHRLNTRSDSLSDATFSRFAAVENDLVLDKLQLVMKWGGEPTHSARYQSQDLGTNMRDDCKLMNREVLDDVRIFTSSEKRVKTSAQIFASAFLNRQDLPEDFISVRKDLLDDSNAAKDVMDKVKKKLKHLLREGNSVPEQFAWPKDVPEPYIVMQLVVDLLKFHRRVMRHNFKKLSGGAAASLAAIGSPTDNKEDKPADISSIQARWCTGEDAELFKERWEKLFSEFCDTEKADPSKVSELYDTMKYDALHNKQFLEWAFTPSQSVLDELDKEESLEANNNSTAEEPVPGIDHTETSLSNGSTHDKHKLSQKIANRKRSILGQPPSTPPLTDHEHEASYFKLFPGSGDSRSKSDKRLGRLRELYRYAKILFDYIGPQEYGISDDEKLEIGLLTSLPLLREIVQDLEELQASGDAKSFIYFTKESHIYTLLNCIMEGGIHTKIKRATIPELDYLSQICFELYEAGGGFDPDTGKETEGSTYSIRIAISPGCHTVDPLDVSLDSKHAIGSAPRRSLTNHQDWKEVIKLLKAKFNTVQLPKSFLAVNVSEKHEEEAENFRKMEEEEKARRESVHDIIHTTSPTSDEHHGNGDAGTRSRYGNGMDVNPV